MKITIETIVHVRPEAVWLAFSTPDDIACPAAEAVAAAS